MTTGLHPLHWKHCLPPVFSFHFVALSSPVPLSFYVSLSFSLSLFLSLLSFLFPFLCPPFNHAVCRHLTLRSCSVFSTVLQHKVTSGQHACVVLPLQPPLAAGVIVDAETQSIKLVQVVHQGLGRAAGWRDAQQSRKTTWPKPETLLTGTIRQQAHTPTHTHTHTHTTQQNIWLKKKKKKKKQPSHR